MSISVGGTPLQGRVASPHPDATVQTGFFGVHSGCRLRRCWALGGTPAANHPVAARVGEGRCPYRPFDETQPLHDGRDACKGRGGGTACGLTSLRRNTGERRPCGGSAARPPQNHLSRTHVCRPACPFILGTSTADLHRSPPNGAPCDGRASNAHTGTARAPHSSRARCRGEEKDAAGKPSPRHAGWLAALALGCVSIPRGKSRPSGGILTGMRGSLRPYSSPFGKRCVSLQPT